MDGDLGAVKVLSLSRTRARIVGCGVFSLVSVVGWGWRWGPMFSGRWRRVGRVRFGRMAVGDLERVVKKRVKAGMLERIFCCLFRFVIGAFGGFCVEEVVDLISFGRSFGCINQ